MRSAEEAAAEAVLAGAAAALVEPVEPVALAAAQVVASAEVAAEQEADLSAGASAGPEVQVQAAKVPAALEVVCPREATRGDRAIQAQV